MMSQSDDAIYLTYNIPHWRSLRCWTGTMLDESSQQQIPPLKKRKKKKTGKLNMRRTYIITNSLRYSIVYMLRFPSFFFSFLFGCCGRMESSHSAAGLCLVLYLTLFVTCFCFADSPPDLMAECRLTHAQKQKKKSTIPPAGAQQCISSTQSERLTDRDLHRKMTNNL